MQGRRNGGGGGGHLLPNFPRPLSAHFLSKKCNFKSKTCPFFVEEKDIISSIFLSLNVIFFFFFGGGGPYWAQLEKAQSGQRGTFMPLMGI